MPLRERSATAFDDALGHVRDHPELDGLRTALDEARAHLDQPMRVAIVGRIKAGKSTMLNALLGEDLAPTGVAELTFNVNRLRYGAEPELLVHFENGRPAERRSFAELGRLSSRSDEDLELLSSIRELELRYPNELLRTFDLIDTPGLGSFFGKDSLNTLRLLGRSVDEVEETTQRESARADALLCLFDRNVADSDRSVVDEFQGPLPGSATPITTIGVLTKVDAYWTASDPAADPLAAGARVAATIMAEPGAERVFYTTLPVCGLLAFGSRTLTGDELETLRALAQAPKEALRRRLRYARPFAEEEFDDLPVAAEQRAQLVRWRLGLYGIWLAAGLLRDGCDEQELRDELWRRSGAAAVRDLILAHFGRRAQLIKTESGLRRGLDEAFRARQHANGSVTAAAGAAGAALERLQSGEPAFEEFALLRQYYRERDALRLREGEAQELLRVTGEHGTSLAARLGFAERTPPADLEAHAERRHACWLARYDEFGADTETMATARVMAGAYRRFAYHARAARRHLELDG